MSAVSKLSALALTYPYQVIRSRIQVRFIFVRYITRLHTYLRTTPLLTYTPTYRPPSNVLGKAKGFADSIVEWGRTSCASFLELASLLSYMRTLHGCYGHLRREEKPKNEIRLESARLFLYRDMHRILGTRICSHRNHVQRINQRHHSPTCEKE
jgi:hypothetical protein